MTLKFLGYVDREHVGTLVRALSSHAATGSAIQTNFQGLVAFASPRRARIIAAAILDPDEKLAQLAESFEVEAEKIGVTRERRTFQPHVTLCRIKQPGDVSAWLEAAKLATTPVRLDEVILYQSQLRPTGAVYTVIARVPLGG